MDKEERVKLTVALANDLMHALIISCGQHAGYDLDAETIDAILDESWDSPQVMPRFYVNDFRKAWGMILETAEDDIDIFTEACIMNKVVTEHTSKNGGLVRTEPYKFEGQSYTPPIPAIVSVRDKLDDILAIEDPIDRGLSLFLFIIRLQLFDVGNLETAFIMANKILIGSGMGVLVVPVTKWSALKYELNYFIGTGYDKEVKARLLKDSFFQIKE